MLLRIKGVANNSCRGGVSLIRSVHHYGVGGKGEGLGSDTNFSNIPFLMLRARAVTRLRTYQIMIRCVLTRNVVYFEPSIMI